MRDSVGHGLGNQALAVASVAPPVAQSQEGQRDVRAADMDWARLGYARVGEWRRRGKQGEHVEHQRD